MNNNKLNIILIISGLVIASSAVAIVVYRRKKEITFVNWFGTSEFLANENRGTRNNNPGNINYSSSNQWKGRLTEDIALSIPNFKKDDRFEMFISPEFGVAAMLELLKRYIANGTNTVQKIISKYAPANENNTQKYINDVCNELKINANQTISFEKNTMFALAKAIIKFETSKILTETMFNNAWNIYN